MADQILNTVKLFLEIHDKLESKYWPMLDLFSERLENKIPLKKVTGDFYKAYRQAKNLDVKEEIPKYWYNIVNQIQRIAIKGETWIQEHKAKGIGYWTLLELAEFNEEDKPKRKKKDSKARNKHYSYFTEEHPNEFPYLCADFLEEKRLPDLGHEQKEWQLYERLSHRMLSILLMDPTYLFDPRLNWPKICQGILNQVKSTQNLTIIDIETTTTK